MSAFICVCLCLSVSVSLTLKLTNPFSHTILLHCHRSEQAGDVLLQSTANRALGTLYSKVGELDKSVGPVLLDGFPRVAEQVDVKGVSDELMSASEREAAYAQVDTLCDLSVQQSTAGPRGKGEL